MTNINLHNLYDNGEYLKHQPMVDAMNSAMADQKIHVSGNLLAGRTVKIGIFNEKISLFLEKTLLQLKKFFVKGYRNRFEKAIGKIDLAYNKHQALMQNSDYAQKLMVKKSDVEQKQGVCNNLVDTKARQVELDDQLNEKLEEFAQHNHELGQLDAEKFKAAKQESEQLDAFQKERSGVLNKFKFKKKEKMPSLSDQSEFLSILARFDEEKAKHKSLQLELKRLMDEINEIDQDHPNLDDEIQEAQQELEKSQTNLATLQDEVRSFHKQNETYLDLTVRTDTIGQSLLNDQGPAEEEVVNPDDPIDEVDGVEDSQEDVQTACQKMLGDIKTHANKDLGDIWGKLMNKVGGDQNVLSWTQTGDTFTMKVTQPLKMWVPSTDDQGKEDPPGGVIMLLGKESNEVKIKLSSEGMEFVSGFSCFVIKKPFGEVEANIFRLKYNGHNAIMFTAGKKTPWPLGEISRERQKTYDNLMQNWGNNGIDLTAKGHEKFLREKYSASSAK